MALISLMTTCVISACLGPISHYTFWVRNDFDIAAPYYIGAFLLFQPVAVISFISIVGLTFQQAILTLWALQSTYWITTLSSIAVYRLFLHPCCKFPGPFWARLWAIWRVRTYIKHEQRPYAALDDLHRKYGDIVRIGTSCSLPGLI